MDIQTEKRRMEFDEKNNQLKFNGKYQMHRTCGSDALKARLEALADQELVAVGIIVRASAGSRRRAFEKKINH